MKSLKHVDSSSEAKHSFTVSAFFKDERQVNDAMWECLHLGVPRDLMDVAVSPGAAQRFFGGQAGKYRDGWFSWAGRGALVGLIGSALLSLGIVLLPGYNNSGVMSMVQFLGPDIGIIVGGAVGALYGWLRTSDINPQMRRALERTDAMLMLMHLQPRDMAEEIGKIFASHGAESIWVEPDSAKSVGAE